MTACRSSCCLYEAVQTAADPDEALMAFLVSTYEAAANLGGWNRGPAGMCARESRAACAAGCRIGEKWNFWPADGTVPSAKMAPPRGR